MFSLAQLSSGPAPAGLPPLPEGPNLSRLRVPAAMDSGLDPSLVALFAAVVVLLLLAILLWRMRRMKRVDAPVDPYLAALATIRHASDSQLEDDQLAESCAGAVHQVLRQRYHLSQAGLTHNELVTKLPLEKENKAALRGFFDLCDRVKFAGHPLDPEAREGLTATARALVEGYRPASEEVRP